MRVTELIVDEGRIHAEESGTGEPVLLLHAGVADRRVWDPVLPALAAAGYRAIRYDMRGYGRSAPAVEPHSLVSDALAVLDAAGIVAAHFVGLSQGAATSVDTALGHPDRVRSLTLVAPGLTGYVWPRLPGFERRMAVAEAGDAHRLAMEYARLWAPLSFTGPVAERDTAAQIIVDQAEQFMRDEMEIEEPSAVDRLGEITVPTLIVLGDSDVDPVGDIGQRLASGIPGARRVTMAGADHMVPLRVPTQFQEVLLGHLAAATAPDRSATTAPDRSATTAPDRGATTART
jgi:pimeloyl-ACP methyl ester carboxylesterase